MGADFFFFTSGDFYGLSVTAFSRGLFKTGGEKNKTASKKRKSFEQQVGLQILAGWLIYYHFLNLADKNVVERPTTFKKKTHFKNVNIYIYIID